MSEINCVLLNNKSEESYEKFVLNHSESMFYHTLRYRDLLVKLLNVKAYYIIAVFKNKILGVLPMIAMTGKYGKVINSLPFYGSNGGVLAANFKASQALINYYNSEFINSISIAASTIISNPLIPNQDYSKNMETITDFRIGQFTKIDFKIDNEDNLMSSFHYKTRNMIRKSIKLGLEISKDNSKLDFLCSQHLKNMNVIGGKAKNPMFFKIFPNIYFPDKDYKIYIASYEGEIISALLLFFHRETVEYYMPVSKADHRDKQPMSLLIFRAMVDASKNGYKLWNWGGTWESQEGVYRFKKRWGTFDKKYYYYTQINNNDILQSSQKELLKEYPDMFVLPFNQLNNVKNA